MKVLRDASRHDVTAGIAEKVPQQSDRLDTDVGRPPGHEPPAVRPRHARLRATWAATVAVSLAVLFTATTTMTVALWVRDPASSQTNPVVDLGFFALGLMVAAGFASQIRGYQVAGLQQAVLALLALAMAGLLGGRVEPFVGALLLLVAAAGAAVLHPCRQRLLAAGRGASKALVALGVVAAIPASAHAASMLDLARAAGPSCFLGQCVQGDRLAESAALVLAVVLVAFLASVRTSGWPVPAWSVGLGAIVLGAASLAFPGEAGALTAPWASAAVLWGASFITVAHIRPAGDRSHIRPLRSEGQATVMTLHTHVTPPTRAAARRAAGWLTGVVAALVAGVSAAGLWASDLYTDGPVLEAMFRGYDLVTLAVVAPVLALTLLPRFADRALTQLTRMSMLTYCIYNYAYYLFGADLNAVLLAHIAIFSGSLAALVLSLVAVDVVDLVSRFRVRTPVRTVTVILLVLGGSLAAIQGSGLARFALTGVAPEEPSQLVVPLSMTRLGAVLDLALLVPVYLLGAIWLWRRRPWGYLTAAVVLLAGAMHQVSYIAGMVFQIRGDIPGAAFDPFEPFIVGLFAIGSLLLLANLRAARPETRGGAGERQADPAHRTASVARLTTDRVG